MTERSEVERLYREHRDRLWRAVFLFAGDRDVATDAVAEAFAQALRRGAGIRSVLPWVWTATFRIAAGELKRRGMAAPVTEGASYELPLETVALIEGWRRPTPVPHLPMQFHINLWHARSVALAGRLGRRGLPAHTHLLRVEVTSASRTGT